MEQHRSLELQLVSAKDLRKCIFLTNMDVFAVVSVSGDTNNGKQSRATTLVRNCDTNPTFNFPMRFTLDDCLLTQHNCLSLKIELVCKRTLPAFVLGVVHVPLKELFDSADPKHMKFITCQVHNPLSGSPEGELSFSYKFGDKFAVPAKLITTKKVNISHVVNISHPGLRRRTNVVASGLSF